MDTLQAILLGIVQGITEFLPVSSSGHLQIAKEVLGVQLEENLTFDVALHAATVLSTIVVLWSEVWRLLKGLFSRRFNAEQAYVLKLVLSMIPIGVIGFLFKDRINAMLDAPYILVIVGAMLLLTATLLAFAYYAKPRQKETISYRDALIIGLAQACAAMPGLSRSGSTIATGLLLGNKKAAVAQFSFLMVLAPILGETLLEARAGELRDEAKIRKVDTPNMDYVMKDDHCVINWFEINTPVGYLSINDTIRDILKPFKGKIFAVKTLLSLKKAMSSGKKEEKSDKKKGKGISVMGVNLRDVNKSMINMAMGFTLKRALMMLGGKFTKEQVLKINDDLNKIKKKKQKREKV